MDKSSRSTGEPAVDQMVRVLFTGEDRRVGRVQINAFSSYRKVGTKDIVGALYQFVGAIGDFITLSSDTLPRRIGSVEVVHVAGCKGQFHRNQGDNPLQRYLTT